MSDVHRWLSYDELAEARGISRASAARLARRRKWQKRPGNDGTPRVAVPEGEDQPPADDRPDLRQDGRPEIRQDNRADISRTISVLEVAVTTLREQLAVANRRAEQAERERDTLRADLARAEEQLRQAEIDRLVEGAARRSSLFSRLWRRRKPPRDSRASGPCGGGGQGG